MRGLTAIVMAQGGSGA